MMNVNQKDPLLKGDQIFVLEISFVGKIDGRHEVVVSGQWLLKTHDRR